MPHKVPSVISRANPLSTKRTSLPYYRREHIMHGKTIKSRVKGWADRQELAFWNARRKEQSREEDTFGYFPKRVGHGGEIEVSTEHKERIIELSTRADQRIRRHNIHKGDWVRVLVPRKTVLAGKRRMDKHFKLEEVAGRKVKVWEIYEVTKVRASHVYLKGWKHKPKQFIEPINKDSLDEAQKSQVLQFKTSFERDSANQGIHPVHYSRVGLLLTPHDSPPIQRVFARRIEQRHTRRDPTTGTMVWDRVVSGLNPRVVWDKERWEKDSAGGGEFTKEQIDTYRIDPLSLVKSTYRDNKGRVIVPAPHVKRLAAGSVPFKEDQKNSADQATIHPRATNATSVRAATLQPVRSPTDNEHYTEYLSSQRRFTSLFPLTLRSPAPRDQTVSDQYILNLRAHTPSAAANHTRYPVPPPLPEARRLDPAEQSVVDHLMPLYLSEELSPRFARNKVRRDWIAGQRVRKAEAERHVQREVDDWVLRGRDGHLRPAMEDAWAGLPDAILKPRTAEEVRVAAKEELAAALERRQTDVRTLRRMGFKYVVERGEWVPGKKWLRIVARRKARRARVLRKAREMRDLRLEQAKGMVVPEHVRMGSKDANQRREQAKREEKTRVRRGEKPSPIQQGKSKPVKGHGNRAKDLKYHL